MMNLDVYKSGTARYSSKFYLMLIQNLFYFPSLYCFKLGIAPQIEDLYGKVQFTGNVHIVHHDKSPFDHHKCWSQRITMVLTFLFHILQFTKSVIFSQLFDQKHNKHLQVKTLLFTLFEKKQINK